MTFPVLVSQAGYIPQSPASLRAQLIANVSAVNTDYTANLPGILIEDISSTDTFALVQCDSSVGELVNSVSPLGANLYILNQLGQIYGVGKSAQFNTSVFVQFEGTPGFFIDEGFTVSDGTFQYIVQDGGSIGQGSPLGLSPLLQAVATIDGSWAVPSNTVNQLVTSVPTPVELTVNNPQDGTPAPTEAETADSYRARTLQAGLVTAQGVSRFFKTLVQNVSGVQPRLVSARLNQDVGNWELIVGGSGDPQAIGDAIFRSMFDLPQLVGSIMAVSGISNAANAVITTELNHGFVTGQIATITGATIVGGAMMTAINGVPSAVTVIDNNNFSVLINTIAAGIYAGGGVVNPNLRNITVSILDYPDTYNITYVNPPQQVVTIVATWNTISTNIISQNAVSQLATPAIVDYVNSIPVGQPLNLMIMNTVFQTAVASLIPAQQLTRLVWTINIDGNGASPIAGTYEILSDPESFFFITIPQVNVVQG